MDMTLTFHAKQENIEKMKNVFNYEEYEAVEQEIGRTDDALSALLLAKEVDPDEIAEWFFDVLDYHGALIDLVSNTLEDPKAFGA